mgnify:CR=1 FL=1
MHGFLEVSDFLASRNIRARTYPSLDAGLAALVAGELVAFVHDAPILRYAVHAGFKDDVAVLPHTYGRQDYAFAVPEGSTLREPLNRVLVEIVSGEDWTEITGRYLPHQP